MENSSKALIIAGTILIVMLVIGAGMFLFGRAGSLSGTVQKNWSQDEVLAFNQKFLKYDGEQKGSRVKELITAVNKSNASTDITVSFSSSKYVTKSSNKEWYPTAQLINSKNYKVSFEYDGGVITLVTISDDIEINI